MGIILLLIRLEEMGLFSIWKEGNRVVCSVEERGLTQRQITDRQKRLSKFIKPFNGLLLKHLKHVPKPENVATGG